MPIIIPKQSNKIIGLFSLFAIQTGFGELNTVNGLSELNGRRFFSAAIFTWLSVGLFLCLLTPVVLANVADSIEKDKLAPQVTTAQRQIVTNISLQAISPETLQNFVQLFDIIRHEYVKPITDEQLFAYAMSGMLAQLDPYAEYLDATSFENLKNFAEGDIGDIGITVVKNPRANIWQVDNVLIDSPAYYAGLKTGDYLHEINGHKLNPKLTLHDVKQRLIGMAGSNINLMVSNEGRRKHTVTIQRMIPIKEQVQVNFDHNIAIIKIPVFQNNTYQQLVNKLTMHHQPISGVLLDIRDNPGGVLSAAIDVASLFLDHANIVQIYRPHQDLQTLTSHNTPYLKDVPMVVLQNRYSASAAEVLTIALQENKRATVMGETSYGKGSIQEVMPIGNRSAAKLTVAYYLSGTGKKIDGVGITPQETFILPEDGWLTVALSYLKTQPQPKAIDLIKAIQTHQAQQLTMPISLEEHLHNDSEEGL